MTTTMNPATTSRALLPFIYHTNTETTALARLPEETRAILEHFEVQGAPEMTEHLAHILTMDQTLAGAGEHDPRVQDVREQQVAYLSPLITQLRQAITENDFFLGFLLLCAATRELHRYAGHTHFAQWCRTLGVEKSLYERATRRAQVWPFLHKLGYTMVDLMDPGFDEVKLNGLIGMARDEKRELEDLRMQHLLQTRVDLVEDLGDEEEDRSSQQRKVRKAMAGLPADEQLRITQESHTEYIEQKRREVERLRELTPEDYLREKDQKLGKPEKPFMVFDVYWHNGELFCSSTHFPCGYAQISAMQKNQADLRFRVKGEEDNSLLSLRDLGDYLSERVTR